MDFDVGALEEAGFVGAGEAVGGGFCEGALHNGEACALRGLGLDDALAGDGGGDDGAIGGALDLLDGVHGGDADDGCAVFGDGVDGAVDGGGIDEGADGVVDEDDVVWRRVQCSEGVGYGALAVFATFYDADFGFEPVVGDEFGDAVDLGCADGDEDLGDAGDGEEGAEAVDEHRHAGDGEELLGLERLIWSGGSSRRHPGSDTRCWKNDKDTHSPASIPRWGGVFFGLKRG